MSDEEIVQEAAPEEPVQEVNADTDVQTEVEAAAEPDAEQVAVEESATSDEEAEKPRRKRGAEARIQELVAKQHEAERENERLRSQLEGNTGAPTVDQFDDYEDYLSARVRFDVRQEQLKEAAAQQQAVEQEIAQQRVMAFQEKVDSAKQEYPDFEAVAFSPEVTPYITQSVGQAVMSTERSADVAYWLGKHPQTAAELARMSPIEAALEIGRIEAALPTPRKVSAAPEPIKPVTGGHDGGQIDPQDMSTEQWIAWRRKQLG